jgi:transposase
MLALSSSCRYFLYRSPADMRFGINSLAGLVRNQLGSDPMSGDVFVFLGKRGNQVRLLQWDTDGFALYIKKLERGTYQWPQGFDTAITSQQLSLLLQGVMLESVRMRKLQSLKTGMIKSRIYLPEKCL